MKTVTGNTAFIPSFTPIEEYFVSVENSSYSISYPQNNNHPEKREEFQWKYSEEG